MTLSDKGKLPHGAYQPHEHSTALSLCHLRYLEMTLSPPATVCAPQISGISTRISHVGIVRLAWIDPSQYALGRRALATSDDPAGSNTG